MPPTDLYAAAQDASGASVSFALPTAGDESGGPVSVGCDWGSGAIFPLGTSVVTCSAWDAAGNGAHVSFRVIVTDSTPPMIDPAPDVMVTAADSFGSVVDYPVPAAWDSVDGAVGVACDVDPGSVFPVGETIVTCSAVDRAGNRAAPVSLRVVVSLLPVTTSIPPTATVATTVVPMETAVPTATVPASEIPTAVVAPTEIPVETMEPTVAPEETVAPTEAPAGSTERAVESLVRALRPEPTEAPASTPAPELETEGPSTPATSPTATPSPTPSPTATVEVQEPVPAGLSLPWPPPGQFVINTYGGPLNGIDAIWGYGDYPVSQEFGHTAFSISHFAWYAYGLSYGLDGFQHPGLDVGMPAGTWLYSPVEGTVRVSGGTPYYTYYGNGDPNVGELLIVTDDGHEVVLGHMGRISVNVGDRVQVGDFVGVSGGFNGDHLHLEVRELQVGGWYRAVDPRQSFMVAVLEEAAAPEQVVEEQEAVLPPEENRPGTSSRRRRTDERGQAQ